MNRYILLGHVRLIQHGQRLKWFSVHGPEVHQGPHRASAGFDREIVGVMAGLNGCKPWIT